MIILDLNGLPGCGKSTYAGELYEILNNQNIECEFFNKNEYINGNNSKQKKIKSYIRLLIPKNFIYIVKLCLKSLKTKKMYQRNMSVKDKIWKWLRVAIINDRVHNIAKKNDDKIVIIDQGIVQDYVDYMLDKKIEENEIIKYEKIYKDLKDRIIIVNLSIEKNISVSRIHKRNREKYDVDKMPEEELKRFLTIYDMKLKMVRKIFNKDFVNIEIDVNNKEEFNKNIEKILKVIMESSERL